MFVFTYVNLYNHYYALLIYCKIINANVDAVAMVWCVLYVYSELARLVHV